MKMLDLFSGIGGFALAAQRVCGEELDIAGFCEIDEFCQIILKKHFPKVPVYDDVRNVLKALHENRLKSTSMIED